MTLLIDYDRDATWWFVYQDNGRTGRLTYSRAWHDAHTKKYAERAARLNLSLPEGLGLIVGAGFGFLMEALADVGRPDVWGTDTSTWIHQRVDLEARRAFRPRILAKDVEDADAASWFAARTGGTFSWVVTEEVMSSYDDAGAASLAAACELLAPGNVTHIVNVPVSRPFTQHTMAEWKAILPSARWEDVRGREAP